MATAYASRRAGLDRDQLRATRHTLRRAGHRAARGRLRRDRAIEPDSGEGDSAVRPVHDQSRTRRPGDVRRRSTRVRYRVHPRVRHRSAASRPRAAPSRSRGRGIEYRPRAASGDPLTASVHWPAAANASRIGSNDLEGLELLADVRDLPTRLLSRRSADGDLGRVLARGLLGIVGLLLTQALALPPSSGLPRRRGARARRCSARSSWCGARPSAVSGRQPRALERLAVELRADGGAGSRADRHPARLARRRDPSGSTVEPLSDEVERVIAEDAR